MIEHVVLPVSNYQKSKKFFTAALKPLGYEQTMEYGEAAGYKEGGHTSFWIAKKKVVPESHVAFHANSKKAVEDFYKAGLKAGGTDNGKPGFRLDYGPDYYAAFVFDPDGSNIEACYFGEKAPQAKKK